MRSNWCSAGILFPLRIFSFARRGRRFDMWLTRILSFKLLRSKEDIGTMWSRCQNEPQFSHVMPRVNCDSIRRFASSNEHPTYCSVRISRCTRIWKHILVIWFRSSLLVFWIGVLRSDSPVLFAPRVIFGVWPASIAFVRHEWSSRLPAAFIVPFGL